MKSKAELVASGGVSGSSGKDKNAYAWAFLCLQQKRVPLPSATAILCRQHFYPAFLRFRVANQRGPHRHHRLLTARSTQLGTSKDKSHVERHGLADCGRRMSAG